MHAFGYTRRFKPAWAALILLLVAGCGGEATLRCADDPRCMTYAITADFPILDPHIAVSPEAGIIFRQLYDTLVVRHPETREFMPGLARSWQRTADGLAYTFQLRGGIRFHDGTAFSAASVAANIDRIFDPAIDSTLARSLLGTFSRYEILDDYTIRFHLSAPFAPLLDSLSQPFLGIASGEALNAYDRLRYQFHQAGSGPFALESYLPGERATLRRNPNYAADPDFYPPLAGDEIERIVFHIAAETRFDVDEALAAEYDVVDDITPPAAASLAANSRLQALPIALPGMAASLLFNTKRPHLGDRDVRLALLLATNRTAIANEVFYNFAPVAWAPLSTATGYAHTGFVDVYAHDLSAAAALLAEAGYRDSDNDGVLERDGTPLELRLSAPATGMWRETVELLRESWRGVGIRLLVDSVPGQRRLLEKARAGETDLIAIDNYGLDPAILGSVFFSDAPYAASRAADERLDAMLLNALHEGDPAARRSMVYTLQSHLMTEALLLPLHENARLRMARSTLTDLRFDAYGFYPLLYNVRSSQSWLNARE